MLMHSPKEKKEKEKKDDNPILIHFFPKERKTCVHF